MPVTRLGIQRTISAGRVRMPCAIAISIGSFRAVVTATTRIDGELSPGGDRWEVAKIGGCWVIERLTYNLEK